MNNIAVYKTDRNPPPPVTIRVPDNTGIAA